LPDCEEDDQECWDDYFFVVDYMDMDEDDLPDCDDDDQECWDDYFFGDDDE